MKIQIIIIAVVVIILLVIIIKLVNYFHSNAIEKNKTEDKTLIPSLLQKYRDTAKEINERNSSIKKVIAKQTYDAGSSYISVVDEDDINQLLEENAAAIQIISFNTTNILEFPSYVFHDKGQTAIHLTNELLNLIKENNQKQYVEPQIISREMMFTCVPGNESLVFSTDKEISENTPSVKYYGTNTVKGLIGIGMEDDGIITNELLIRDGDSMEKIYDFLKDVSQRPYIFIFSIGSNLNMREFLIKAGLAVIDYNNCFLAYIIPFESTINQKKIDNEFLEFNNYYVYNGVSFPMTIITNDNFIHIKWQSFKLNV